MTKQQYSVYYVINVYLIDLWMYNMLCYHYYLYIYIIIHIPYINIL